MTTQVTERGDRPPYFIRISDLTHDTEQSELTVLTYDTELVGPAIDCSTREISLDRRTTFSAFFLKRYFMACAARNTKLWRVYDKHLVSVESAVFYLTGDITSWNRNCDDWRRARRKRLQRWVEGNKKRISEEHRLITEDAVVRMSQEQRWLLKRIAALPNDSCVGMDDEIVPKKCTKGRRELMKWARNEKGWKRAEEEAAFIIHARRCGCSLM